MTSGLPDYVTDELGATDSYGLGTRIGHHNFRDVAVGHDGDVEGYVADLTVLPDERIAVAVLVPADLDPGFYSRRVLAAVRPG